MHLDTNNLWADEETPQIKWEIFETPSQRNFKRDSSDESFGFPKLERSPSIDLMRSHTLPRFELSEVSETSDFKPFKLESPYKNPQLSPNIPLGLQPKFNFSETILPLSPTMALSTVASEMSSPRSQKKTTYEIKKKKTQKGNKIPNYRFTDRRKLFESDQEEEDEYENIWIQPIKKKDETEIQKEKERKQREKEEKLEKKKQNIEKPFVETETNKYLTGIDKKRYNKYASVVNQAEIDATQQINEDHSSELEIKHLAKRSKYIAKKRRGETGKKDKENEKDKKEKGDETNENEKQNENEKDKKDENPIKETPKKRQKRRKHPFLHIGKEETETSTEYEYYYYSPLPSIAESGSELKSDKELNNFEDNDDDLNELRDSKFSKFFDSDSMSSSGSFDRFPLSPKRNPKKKKVKENNSEGDPQRNIYAYFNKKMKEFDEKHASSQKAPTIVFQSKKDKKSQEKEKQKQEKISRENETHENNSMQGPLANKFFEGMDFSDSAKPQDHFIHKKRDAFQSDHKINKKKWRMNSVNQ